jgi:hypothetical protein
MKIIIDIPATAEIYSKMSYDFEIEEIKTKL